MLKRMTSLVCHMYTNKAEDETSQGCEKKRLEEVTTSLRIFQKYYPEDMRPGLPSDTTNGNFKEPIEIVEPVKLKTVEAKPASLYVKCSMELPSEVPSLPWKREINSGRNNPPQYHLPNDPTLSSIARICEAIEDKAP
ncbi:hypothetical protein Tco_1465851 [Tanacetum coccineum]